MRHSAVPSVFRFLFPLFLSALPKAFAVPLYYDFGGEVVHTTAASHALGQSVRYVFQVDRDVDGYTVDGGGAIHTVEDFYEGADWYNLSFFSAYMGGDALTEDNPDSPIKESDFAGIDLVHHTDYFSALRGSNSDPGGFDLIDVYSDDTRIGDWTVGQILRAENLVANGPGELNSGYSSLLTLNGITGYNPLDAVASVPEPSGFILMGSGLLLLAGAAFRRNAFKTRS